MAGTRKETKGRKPEFDKSTDRNRTWAEKKRNWRDAELELLGKAHVTKTAKMLEGKA